MRVQLNSRTLGILLPVIFFGGIGVTALSGFWITESTKVPARFETGDFAGLNDPADIRGSYTFGDIENAFAVPAAVLADAFGFGDAPDPAAVRTKEVEDRYGGLGLPFDIGTSAIRWFVALYTALPYTPEPETGLPQRAVEILVERQTLNANLTSAVRAVAVRIEEGELQGTPAGGAAAATASQADSAEERLIKGKTTFGELLQWGVEAQAIEAVLGGEMPGRSKSIRDYAMEAGVEFSRWKTALQELVDAAPR